LRRLPKFLRIGGLKHTVEKVDDLAIESGHGAEDGILYHRAYGTYEPGPLNISIDPSSSAERIKVTLMHETLHAIINTARLGMVPADEEEFVGRISPLLLDFIRSNRGAILYLQES
jgi:hypothetical protein